MDQGGKWAHREEEEIEKFINFIKTQNKVYGQTSHWYKNTPEYQKLDNESSGRRRQAEAFFEKKNYRWSRTLFHLFCALLAYSLVPALLCPLHLRLLSSSYYSLYIALHLIAWFKPLRWRRMKIYLLLQLGHFKSSTHTSHTRKKNMVFR